MGGTALELASGTGQHITAFARAMPGLDWQPSELDPDRIASIAAYMTEAGLTNVHLPVPLDACQPGWGAEQANDLIFLVNLLHLIRVHEVRTLLHEAAQALRPGGVFMAYGPFMRGGQLTSEGDRQFHARLVSADPSIGYKDVSEMRVWLHEAGLSLAEIVEMPANNLAMIARRG